MLLCNLMVIDIFYLSSVESTEHSCGFFFFHWGTYPMAPQGWIFSLTFFYNIDVPRSRDSSPGGIHFRIQWYTVNSYLVFNAIVEYASVNTVPQ
jgi:hypothetical protein